jgi:hypothetical protein
MSKTDSPPAQAWCQEWAYKKAAQAVRYLAENYPECGGLPALDPYQEAAHEAAVREDRGGYEESLREYMRAGRREALKKRSGVRTL